MRWAAASSLNSAVSEGLLFELARLLRPCSTLCADRSMIPECWIAVGHTNVTRGVFVCMNHYACEDTVKPVIHILQHASVRHKQAAVDKLLACDSGSKTRYFMVVLLPSPEVGAGLYPLTF